MIRSHYFRRDGILEADLTPERCGQVLRDPAGLLWIDMVGEGVGSAEPFLRGQLGFHPLAVDDALQETHIPKVDDWGSYLYIVLEAIEFDRATAELHSLELDVFLGQHYLVSYHDRPLQALDRVWRSGQRDERFFKNGAAHLLYRVVDELAVDYVNVVDAFDDEIEAMEDRIFQMASPDLPQRLVALKRAALHLRRSLSPMREVLNRLARDEYVAVALQERIYFRDVYDHFVRLHDLSESLRDLISGALEIYLSVINNRMNDIMKTLTIITTLFMPLSFVTGFFGMNFFQPVAERLKPWSGELMFVMTLLGIAAVPLLMYRWMRRRGWM